LIKRRKKIEKDANKWKDNLCSWTERVNVGEVSLIPKATYRFNAIPIKILKTFFTELEHTILKSVWKLRGLQITKGILRKE